MVLLSQDRDDWKVLLATEAGGGMCWGCPGAGKAEGMGLEKLIPDGFLCERGDNLSVPAALRKVEHSSPVSS